MKKYYIFIEKKSVILEINWLFGIRCTEGVRVLPLPGHRGKTVHVLHPTSQRRGPLVFFPSPTKTPTRSSDQIGKANPERRSDHTTKRRPRHDSAPGFPLSSQQQYR